MFACVRHPITNSTHNVQCTPIAALHQPQYYIPCIQRRDARPLLDRPAQMGYGELTAPLLNLWWLAKKSGRTQAARLLSRLFTFQNIRIADKVRLA